MLGESSLLCAASLVQELGTSSIHKEGPKSKTPSSRTLSTRIVWGLCIADDNKYIPLYFYLFILLHRTSLLISQLIHLLSHLTPQPLCLSFNRPSHILHVFFKLTRFVLVLYFLDAFLPELFRLMTQLFSLYLCSIEQLGRRHFRQGNLLLI